MSGFIFTTAAAALAVTDTGDFLQLRGAAGAIVEILEIRVSQTSDTTLAMNAISIQRGTAGSGGAARSEYEYDTAGPTALVTAFSLATVDVGSVDLAVVAGWNILQEFVWLPTPEMQLHLAASDHLGISLLNADTLTVNAQVTWREIGV
jgi:hypothetical protein